LKGETARIKGALRREDSGDMLLGPLTKSINGVGKTTAEWSERVLNGDWNCGEGTAMDEAISLKFTESLSEDLL
jgi:hypothetical protein